MAAAAKRLKIRFLLDVDNTLILDNYRLNNELLGFLVALQTSLATVHIDMEVQLFTARSTLNSIMPYLKLDSTQGTKNPYLLTDLLEVLKDKKIKLDEALPVIHYFDHIHGLGKSYKYHIKAFETAVKAGSLKSLKEQYNKNDPLDRFIFNTYIGLALNEAKEIFDKLIAAKVNFDEKDFTNKIREFYFENNPFANEETVNAVMKELEPLFAAWYFNALSDFAFRALGFLEGDKAPVLIRLQETYQNDLMIWIDDISGLWTYATNGRVMKDIYGHPLPPPDIGRIAFIHQTDLLKQPDYYRKFLAVLPRRFDFVAALLNPMSPGLALPFADTALNDGSSDSSDSLDSTDTMMVAASIPLTH